MRKLIGIFIFLLMVGSCVPKTKEVRPTTDVEPPPPPKPAKIALVLGAGASKGFAHVGVIKILESNKIPIHMIVGTSVGSVVGSFYASGYDAFQLQRLSFSIEKGDIVEKEDQGVVAGFDRAIGDPDVVAAVGIDAVGPDAVQETRPGW